MTARPNTTVAPKRTAKAAATKPATTPAKAQPAPEVEEDFSYLLEKEPTQLHLNYQAWLKETTGVELDLKTIQVVCVTRMAFQKSEANQKDLKGRKAEWAKRQAAKKEATAKAKLEQAKKLAEELGMDLKALVG